MRKLLSSSLIFILVFMLFTVTANAATTKISFAPASSNITVGKEFEVVLSLTDLGIFPDGINAASGTLSYDSNYVSYVSMTPKGSWTLSQFNQTNGKFLLFTANMDLVKTGPIVAIKFKLIGTPSETTNIITLNEPSITDGATDEVSFDPLNITIKASLPTPPPPVNNTVTNNTVNNTVVNNTVNNTVVNNTINNTVVNNTVNNTVVNNTINNTVDNNTTDNNTINNVVNNTSNNVVSSNIVINGNTVDNSTSKKPIPYAGLSNIIIISIIITIITSVYSYFKYKDLNI